MTVPAEPLGSHAPHPVSVIVLIGSGTFGFDDSLFKKKSSATRLLGFEGGSRSCLGASGILSPMLFWSVERRADGAEPQSAMSL